MSEPLLDVPGLLRQHGLRPDKRLGQNFLIDTAALERIVAAAGVEPTDTILEVGPGLGSLTRKLAQSAKRVIAVELDEDLIPVLKTVIAPFPNVEVVQGDILALDPARLMASEGEDSQPGYQVVANIPYYITSALIRHLLESSPRPRRLTLTVQREVAERIVAGPGDLSLLALSVQVYGQPQIVARIPAGAFYPPPQVDSAVVRVDLYPQPALPPDRLKAFFRLVKAGFSQKRKTLRNALAGGLQLEPARAAALLQTAEIDPHRRAETVSLEEWGHLVKAYLEIEAEK
jgi:16S rRNA (adenine1518-N6/adenine1519-N6)-dimethyltransferase